MASMHVHRSPPKFATQPKEQWSRRILSGGRTLQQVQISVLISTLSPQPFRAFCVVITAPSVDPGEAATQHGR